MRVRFTLRLSTTGVEEFGIKEDHTDCMALFACPSHHVGVSLVFGLLAAGVAKIHLSFGNCEFPYSITVHPNLE